MIQISNTKQRDNIIIKIISFNTFNFFSTNYPVPTCTFISRSASTRVQCRVVIHDGLSKQETGGLIKKTFYKNPCSIPELKRVKFIHGKALSKKHAVPITMQSII